VRKSAQKIALQVAEKDKIIDEQAKTIEKALEEKEKERVEKEKALAELAELKNHLKK